MRSPSSAYRPRKNRWLARYGWATVNWPLTYTADWIYLLIFSQSNICSVTHSTSPRKDSPQSMGTFRFKLVQAIWGSCIDKADGWNTGSSLRGRLRIRKRWRNAGCLLHYSRGCHWRAKNWCDPLLLGPCDCVLQVCQTQESKRWDLTQGWSLRKMCTCAFTFQAGKH